MHCHTAWHASSGLAMQILENTKHIVLHNQTTLQETCNNWDYWMANDKNQALLRVASVPGSGYLIEAGVTQLRVALLGGGP